MHIATISSNVTSSSRSGTITVTYNAGQDSCSTSAIPISQSAETQTCDCDSFAFSGTEEVDTNYITVKVKNNTGNAIYVDHVELYYANGNYDDEHDFGSVECDGSSATTTLTDPRNTIPSLYARRIISV